MSIPEGYIEEIRNSIKLSSIVQNKVKLIKRGKNFVGLCPFHNEKTPSFNILDDEGFYHCFGCGAHGDLISFIRNTENIGFVEAVEKISSLAGIKLPSNYQYDDSLYQKKKELLRLMDVVSDYYLDQLYSSNGIEALNYLKKRGLNDNLIKDFKLGFAPKSGLKPIISSKGFTNLQMLEVGLIRKQSSSSEEIEVFRDRITFSIFNSKKNIIGFGGRALFQTNAKYINSPNSELYLKSSNLYGLSHARELYHKTKKLLVVEGYMDVISINKSSLAAAVSPLGTSMSEKQIKLLWSMSKNPTLCFDGDIAGKTAAWRLIKKVIPMITVGYEINFAWLPKGTDPDEMIQKNQKNEFVKIINNTSTLIETIWSMLLDQYDYSKVDSKAKIWKEAKSIVYQINDKTLRRAYLDEVDKLINLMRKNDSVFNRENKLNQIKRPKVGIQILYKTILSILIHHPNLSLDYAEQIIKLDIDDSNYKKIISLLLDLVIDNDTLDREEFFHHIEGKSLSGVYKSLCEESLYRRMGFNPSDLDKEVIESKFVELIDHALKSSKNFDY